MSIKDKATFGIFGVLLFCGQAIYATESASIGNLTETSVKISEMDIDKDFGEAGRVLDSFYTGATSKKEKESPAVYAEASTTRGSTPAKDICNAKPTKIVLSGKVPPVQSQSDNSKHNRTEIPIQAGALAAGAAALALAGRKKGYLEDLDTVTDFLVDLVTSNSNPKPPPPNENYDVHPSGGAPTCNGENYCTRP